jgi:hypothetical protein
MKSKENKKNTDLLKTTTNKSVYNKALKKTLRCSYCKPNRGCNSKSKKWYGSSSTNIKMITFPDWKNQKVKRQWMKKHCQVIEKISRRGYKYYDVEFQ